MIYPTIQAFFALPSRRLRFVNGDTPHQRDSTKRVLQRRARLFADRVLQVYICPNAQDALRPTYQAIHSLSNFHCTTYYSPLLSHCDVIILIVSFQSSCCNIATGASNRYARGTRQWQAHPRYRRAWGAQAISKARSPLL